MRSALVLAIVVLAAPALADDKATCLTAHEDAQRLRGDGKLRAAREKLLACSADACPSLIKLDCTRWLPEVERDQPTVIVRAKDESGADIADVNVEIDGVVVAKFLDGKPIAVDPGTHTFRLARPEGATIEQQVVVAAGQKNRVVDVAFPNTPASPIETEEPKSLAPFVLGGVGLAGVAGFAVLGLTARARLSELRDTCAPNCDPSERGSLRTQLILADVSLVIGVAALSAATYLWLRPTPSTAIALTPSPTSAMASLNVTF